MSIYPSDFGVGRLAREEREGPSELAHHDSEDEGVESSDEGRGYSTEKLRSYQLNQLKWANLSLVVVLQRLMCTHDNFYPDVLAPHSFSVVDTK